MLRTLWGIGHAESKRRRRARCAAGCAPMTLIVPCARCGNRFMGQAEFDAHRCDDAVSRQILRSNDAVAPFSAAAGSAAGGTQPQSPASAVPELEDIRSRMSDAGTMAFNH